MIDGDIKQTKSMVMTNVIIGEIKLVSEANIAREAQFVTDGAVVYLKIGQEFAEHHTVNHRAGGYVNRENPAIKKTQLRIISLCSSAVYAALTGIAATNT